MCEGGVGVIMSVHPRGCAFYLFKKSHESHLYRPLNLVQGSESKGLIEFILKIF